MIATSDLPIEHIGQSDNGLSAYDFMQITVPDILITDIRMPGLDGLELIKKVRALSRDMRIIVISGYDDFSYVQQAMRYGALDYILKPIQREEFYRSLREAILVLEKQKAHESAEFLIPELIRKLAYDIALGKNEQGQKFLSLMEISEHQKISFTAGAIVFDDSLINCTKLTSILQDAVAKFSPRDMPILFETSRCTAGFFYIENSRSKDFSILFERFFSEFPSGNIKNMAFSLGDTVYKLEQLEISYQKALLTLSQRQLSQYGLIKNQLDVEGRLMDSKDKRNRLVAAVQLRDAPKLAALTHETLTELFAVNGMTHRQASAFFVSAATDIMEILYATREPAKNLVEEGSYYCSHAEETMQIEKIAKDFLEYGKRVIEFLIQMDKSVGTSELIGRITSFIRDHSQENITLSSLANNFHLNASYLSTLFKQKTGSNFLEYLTQIRMEKAAYYLRESTMNISEIALLVGYDNIRYFSRQFKKWCGKIPTQYRANV